MNTIKRWFAAVLTGLLLFTAVPAVVVTSTGCASQQVADGHDPFVVSAERDIAAAFRITDSFLQWEFENRETAGAGAAELANGLRAEFPRIYASATDTLRVYKRTRTPEAKADLTTWLALLNHTLLEVSKYLPADKR